MLTHSRPYGVTTAFERAIGQSRADAETAEREAVAAEIRELLAQANLSQAEFASRLGTSASRLSTYASGKVTPSAALLLRMRRVANQAWESSDIASISSTAARKSAAPST